MARRRSSPTEERAGSFGPTTRRRSSRYSSVPLATRRNAGHVAGALRQRAADTAGRRSLVASPPCTRSCSPPLPGNRLRAGGALDRDAADAVQVDESLTDLAALADDLDRGGQALLALQPKPLVVQPFDGLVERPQLTAAASRDVQRVNGLGPVSAQANRIGGVLDQPKLDRVGDGPSPRGSLGARLVRRLHPQVLRHARRGLLLERVPLAGDLEYDVHSAEPISALVAACSRAGEQLQRLTIDIHARRVLPSVSEWAMRLAARAST